jgi:hypothetical protein
MTGTTKTVLGIAVGTAMFALSAINASAAIVCSGNVNADLKTVHMI